MAILAKVIKVITQNNSAIITIITRPATINATSVMFLDISLVTAQRAHNNSSHSKNNP